MEEEKNFNRSVLKLNIVPVPDYDSAEESEDDILAVLDTPDDFDKSLALGIGSNIYSRVYDLQKFSEIMPHVYIRDKQISLNVVEIDHQPGPISFLNQHVLTISLHHGSCHWIIKRKSKQISSLHNQLRYFKAKLKIPAASSQERERRQSLRDQVKSRKKSSGKRLVKFPRKELQRMDANAKSLIETYLSNILQHSLLRAHHGVLDFFEISPLSFVTSLGLKLKEGYVKKRSHCSSPNMCGSSNCVGRFKTMWLILKESYLFLLSPSKGHIRLVMLMDSAFQLSHGFRQTGVTSGLRITNLSRSLLLKCDCEDSAKEWASAIERTKNTYGSDFIKENRFFSFSPVRKEANARWYVDGSRYISDVADLLELAQEEIFITDWWLSPDIYMKRPDLTGKYWMLSEVLKRQAERGVKVFIILYKEVELALQLNSLYSKHALSILHNNIKVLRSPDHIKSGALYWAHHEKMVIIDQTFSFIGGIDLCYGRWDDYRHKLVDIGHGGRQKKRQSTQSLGLGHLIQSAHFMANGMVKDSAPAKNMPGDMNVEGENFDNISDSNCSTPMPRIFANSDCDGEDDTHEMNGERKLQKGTSSLHSSMEDKLKWRTRAAKAFGIDEFVGDFRRSRGMSMIGKAKEKLYRTRSVDSEFDPSSSSDEDEEKLTRRKRLQHRLTRRLKKYKNRTPHLGDRKTGSLTELHMNLEHETASSVHLWVGKDYVNWITKDLYEAHSPFKDTVNRMETPRMPWHDIALYVEGECARDAARHFIQRWNAIKARKVKKRDHYPFLIPKTYHPSKLKYSCLYPKHRVKCQILRSVGLWSAGLYEKEQSIYLAYIDAINKSKHYIYIENQFFITSSSQMKGEVHNNVGLHLYERILKAHRNNEKFRVYVVLPLLPAFEGLIGTPNGTPMQYIIYYIYSSIIRGSSSLIGKLMEANITWQNYICFCSTRTHEMLNDEYVSELIYIHSKLLIVDDRIVICGSANINDRSLLGDRDSEVALRIEDVHFNEGKMNGLRYRSGEFASSLRMYLFREHLGIKNDSDIDISDPVCDKFFKEWQGIASRNTKIYDEVFNCIPCDAATNFTELRKIKSKPSLAKLSSDHAAERLEKIQGHLVLYPLLFLKEEILKPGPGNKEFLLPIEMWT